MLMLVAIRVISVVFGSRIFGVSTCHHPLMIQMLLVIHSSTTTTQGCVMYHRVSQQFASCCRSYSYTCLLFTLIYETLCFTYQIYALTFLLHSLLLSLLLRIEYVGMINCLIRLRHYLFLILEDFQVTDQLSLSEQTLLRMLILLLLGRVQTQNAATIA